MDEEAIAEAIAQVPEVVAMTRDQGGQQLRLREMASEFFAGLSDSEKGRRALHEHGATRVCLMWIGDRSDVSVNVLTTLVNLSADRLENRWALKMTKSCTVCF